MKRGGKNKTRHRNTLEMKAEKRTAMSACDTVTLLATCPVFGTPFQGVPGPVRGYWGGGEGGGESLPSLLPSLSPFWRLSAKKFTRSRRSEQWSRNPNGCPKPKKPVDNETGK